MSEECLVNYEDADYEELLEQYEKCQFCPIYCECGLAREIEAEIEDREFWMEID
jgi:hypothetical protein